MSETVPSLRRKLGSARELQSVVRTMKALAAANIGQYERAASALGDYRRIVELGLGACFRENLPAIAAGRESPPAEVDGVGAVVFGSDQGLVGQFNEIVADFALAALAGRPGKPCLWAVGERVHARLADAGLPPIGLLAVPHSVHGITALVGQIQMEAEAQRARGNFREFHIFHNRPQPGAPCEPASQRLLPLDAVWMEHLVNLRWPTQLRPEAVGGGTATLRGLIREYLFISLFRACAESLASENATRLAAMQRADQNIDELRKTLKGAFHQLRQSGIDEELFDVISGFEALSGRGHPPA